MKNQKLTKIEMIELTAEEIIIVSGGKGDAVFPLTLPSFHGGRVIKLPVQPIRLV